MGAMDLRLRSRRGSLDGVEAITAEAEGFAAGAGVPKIVARRLGLVVEELVTNAVSYGSEGVRDVAVEVTLTLDGDRIGVRISDDAPAFDPFAQAPKELGRTIETREVGGLGLVLVQALAEGIRYRRARGRNVVELDVRIDGVVAQTEGNTQE